MVKVAIPVTDGKVSGPGEAETVKIFEVAGEPKLLEEYPNPALKAMAARGAHMLKSALDRGVQVFIVAEMGPPGVRLIQGKAKAYIANEGTPVEEALKLLNEGKLQEIVKPTHDHPRTH
ncbi:NifB/NifX family molybdenum-iron cluster-binding protein [Sulfuracidifex metallicus]|uniref:Diguanylate cyclase n=1 Tax=Sulfuracidifex metallicus DSM 6482 = JCM 9184 TaxID=523847 RepID=A0A6A9QP44_SULME|nr:NifB/NifX family molybdenum-iron cluster-binding protein [Sulfuracidifex metallicus]MUN29929.1 diguanylate cyclase [Sulfuracidifex metallicus DSM 6482 = JCM 9184]WOE51687.1 NifB/NifX family molybdenum-iron cluster-binding protein [Sulfuracidifex metallicus DSM 6482 = JCM 9184]